MCWNYRIAFSFLCTTVLLCSSTFAVESNILWMEGYFAATNNSSNFADGPVLLWQKDDTGDTKGNFFETDGSPICGVPFDEALPGFHNGLAIVGRNGKYGYIDVTGAQVIPCKYDAADPFTEDGLALVRQGDRLFAINMTGDEVADLTHTYLPEGGFHSGRLLVKSPSLGGGYHNGYVDNQGCLAIPLDFSEAYGFKNGIAVVAQNIGGQKIYGCINTDGKWIIPCEYDGINGSSEGLIVAKRDDQITVFDESGALIFTTNQYSYIDFFNNGLAAAKSNNAYGFVGKNGATTIRPQFHFAAPFHDGLALVSNDIWQDGYINTSGMMVIPYMDMLKGDDFSEGLARVRTEVDGKEYFGYIDHSGQLLIPTIFKTASPAFRNGAIVVRGDNFTPGILRNPLDKPSPWAINGIQNAVDAGLTTVRIDRCYLAPITRSIFAELIVTLSETCSGVSLPADGFPFLDTADRFVRKAAGAGLVNGMGDGSKFEPDSQVTREQLAAMLCRTIRYLEAETGKTVLSSSGELSTFIDANQISPWATQDMAVLNAAGILNGTSSKTISPKDTCTVEQAIIMVLRAYQRFGTTGTA